MNAAGWYSRGIGLRANVGICVTRNGQVIKRQHVHNTLVAGGRRIVANLLANVGFAPTIISLGVIPTAVRDSDVGLYNELFSNLITRRVVSAASVTYTLNVTTLQANGITFQEVGLFAGGVADPDSGVPRGATTRGVLVARAVLSPLAKDATMEFNITWELSITST
jgi:hypothetical protein